MRLLQGGSNGKNGIPEKNSHKISNVTYFKLWREKDEKP